MLARFVPFRARDVEFEVLAPSRGEPLTRGGLAWRVALGALATLAVSLGGLVLADNLGYEIPGELWSYWPFLLIGLGTVMLLWPGDRGEGRSGFWLVVAGTYGLIGVFGLFGLGWGSAWPIFLIAYGVLLVHDSWRGGVGPLQARSDRTLQRWRRVDAERFRDALGQRAKLHRPHETQQRLRELFLQP